MHILYNRSNLERDVRPNFTPPHTFTSHTPVTNCLELCFQIEYFLCISGTKYLWFVSKITNQHSTNKVNTKTFMDITIILLLYWQLIISYSLCLYTNKPLIQRIELVALTLSVYSNSAGTRTWLGNQRPLYSSVTRLFICLQLVIACFMVGNCLSQRRCRPNDGG